MESLSLNRYWKGANFMNKIRPFLWFDDKAEEATNYYLSIFKNSRMLSVVRHGEEGPAPAGSVMYTQFILDGQEFMALNGGPYFTFSPAISLFVNCETQAEVDSYWEKLSAGGEKGQCGWLKDKYGLSWQIVPNGINEYLHGKDAAGSKRAMDAMLKMTKLDLEALQKAYFEKTK
jgi:predicted 3-demethylubiquinone-9 3-methyltransferase (glyoxalase superfamily)